MLVLLIRVHSREFAAEFFICNDLRKSAGEKMLLFD
jgi:hypothetical protein